MNESKTKKGELSQKAIAHPIVISPKACDPQRRSNCAGLTLITYNTKNIKAELSKMTKLIQTIIVSPDT